MRLDNALAYGEAETRSGERSAGSCRRLRELAKQLRQLFFRNSVTLVLHPDLHLDADCLRRQVDGRRIGRVANSVGQQVDQHLADTTAIGHHEGQVGGQVDRHVTARNEALERATCGLDQLPDFDRLGSDGQRTGLNPGDIEQIRNQVLHVVGLLFDDPVELRGGRWVQGDSRLNQCGGGPFDRTERSAQLVADHGQKIGAHLLQLL